MTPAEAEMLVRGFEYAVGVYPTDDPVYVTARAALLAAMEPVGVEGLVDEVVGAGVECDAVTVNVLCGHGLKPGDRVRVSKVEAPDA